MLEPVTVWKVELIRGREPIDVRGTLSLAEDALVFEDDLGGTTRIAFADTTRAKRVIGSPILMIHRRDRDVGQTAFYFAEPPPLQPPDPATLSLREAAGRRPSKRRQRRNNTGYLAGRGSALKPTIQAWVSELQGRISQTRGGSGAG